MGIFRLFSISIYTFLFSVSALAADMPSLGSVVNCISSEYLAITINNGEIMEPLTCADIQGPAEEALKKVRAISPVDFVAPHLIVDNWDGSSSYFDSSLSELHFEYSKKQLSSMAVLAHEIGHTIFAQYNFTLLPTMIDYYPYVLDYQSYVRECVNVEDASKATISCDPYNYTSVLDLFSANWDESYPRFRYVQSAYHELFADLIAAVAFDDPDVMTSTCHSIQYVCAYRSFAFENKVGLFATDEHARLVTFRKKLWDQLIVSNKNNIKATLNDIALMFYNDCATHFEIDYSLSILDMTMKENARLTQAIDDYLWSKPSAAQKVAAQVK